MTAKEAARLLEQKAIFRDREGFVFEVYILDVRSRFGTTDYLITPVHGAGQRWVESNRVEIN